MRIKEVIFKLQGRIHLLFYHMDWINHYQKYINRYSSYRYSLRHSNKSSSRKASNYFAARPNPGAGIGHQMANWIAGYWFAREFGLKFAHIPFSNVQNPFVGNDWDSLLGFGEGEQTIVDLKKEGYKTVLLPLFDEDNPHHIAVIQRIIDSYSKKKVIFLAEQDQFLRDQYKLMDVLQEKFYSAHARKDDKLIYKKECFNIAVHIRRGDIVQRDGQNNPNLTMRYQKLEYFAAALRELISRVQTDKTIHVYVFSQGNDTQLNGLPGDLQVHYCNDMGAQESFLHMVYADALITSKSSFSYKAALLNKGGIKVCPALFWHGYPNSDEWLLADEDGQIIGEK